MPRGDRTGPYGEGPKTGRQMEYCVGNENSGRGLGRQFRGGFGQGMDRGGGRGRNKGGAFGAGGFCVCAKCGTKVQHQRGIKCTRVKCPECGHIMIREELLKDKSG